MNEAFERDSRSVRHASKPTADRPRSAPCDPHPPRTVTAENAVSCLKEMLKPCSGRTVNASDALGRVLLEDVFSPFDYPPADISLRDGFAARASDIESPAPLRIVGAVRAGDIRRGKVVGPGQAVRIATGAPIPPGADLVIPLEEIEIADDDTVLPLVDKPPTRDYISKQGSSVKKGDRILRKGVRITPEVLSRLAMAGKTSVSVSELPAVGILTTGSELLQPGALPREGKIFASHGWYLKALTELAGAKSVLCDPVPDEPEKMTEALSALFGCDLILTTGGTGKGERDLIRETMQRLGARTLFQDILMRPCGTTALYLLPGGALLLSLPGGEGGVRLGFELLVRPALENMLGLVSEPSDRYAVCFSDMHIRRDLHCDRYLEAQLINQNGTLIAALPQGNGCSNRTFFNGVRGWIEIPSGRGRIEKGSLVRMLVDGSR